MTARENDIGRSLELSWWSSGAQAAVKAFAEKACPAKTLNAVKVLLFDGIYGIALVDQDGMMSFLRMSRCDSVNEMFKFKPSQENICDALDRAAEHSDLYFWTGNAAHVLMKRGSSIEKMIVEHDLEGCIA